MQACARPIIFAQAQTAPAENNNAWLGLKNPQGFEHIRQGLRRVTDGIGHPNFIANLSLAAF